MLKRNLLSAVFILSSLFLISFTTDNKAVSANTPKGNFFADTTAILSDSAGIGNTMPVSMTTTDDRLQAPQIILNKNVTAFVDAYIKKNGYFLGKTKGKNASNLKIMNAVFEKHSLPVELKYLSFVESGWKLNAGSWAGAVGPWALMPVAAKEYGLKISGKKDERLDYNKSSHAAAKLLNNLFEQYGDWLLVIAAYNCGPGGIQKAIKKSGSRNYWTLQNFLPEETRKHVKKFIAVHYYFEGRGSVATMTKAEKENHIKEVEAFTAQQQQQTEKMDSVSTVAVK